MTLRTQLPSDVVFYDGVCALCNNFVIWLSKADKKGVFFFAPLQSQHAQTLAEDIRFPKTLESIVYVQKNKIYTRSSAIFAIAEKLNWPWRALLIGRVFPRVITDAVYNLVAKMRYKTFGRYDVCPVPDPHLFPRFLS